MIAKKKGVPEGLWMSCPGCKKMVFKKDVEENLNVCQICNYHFRIEAMTRIKQLVDENSFEGFLGDLVSSDPLKFRENSYKKRLSLEKRKIGLKEAIIIGKTFIKGRAVILAVMEPNFLMGSMGSVVGEKFSVAVEKAIEESLPLVAVISSGGARIHEGVVSLFQMAKVSVALVELKRAGRLYIAVLTDPTLGGVTASFAMLGDIIIAEPRAMIGFAGRRTIRETINEELPEDFQTAEFLLKRGFIDIIVQRKDLRKEIARLIDYCQK